MANLSDLLRDLDRALAGNDLDRVTAVRRTIAEGHPETEQGAEASYKLGLAALFHRRDASEAETHFRRAAKAKSPTWSLPARVSLGTVLYHAGKLQQAIFELRKAAASSPVSLVSTQAKALLALALRENAQPKESERAREDAKRALAQLSRTASPADAALARWMLGMELKFDGDREGARKELELAVGSGLLPPSETASAMRALKTL